jgi:hypothetical protein
MNVKPLHATFLSSEIEQTASGTQAAPAQQFSVRYPIRPFIAE